MAPDLKPLFSSRDEVMVCLHCDAPMEIDPANCKPGEIHYKPCACGQTGTPRCVLVDEINVTEAQLAAYLKAVHDRVADAVIAAALVLEESG